MQQRVSPYDSFLGPPSAWPQSSDTMKEADELQAHVNKVMNRRHFVTVVHPPHEIWIVDVTEGCIVDTISVPYSSIHTHDEQREFLAAHVDFEHDRCVVFGNVPHLVAELFPETNKPRGFPIGWNGNNYQPPRDQQIVEAAKSV